MRRAVALIALILGLTPLAAPPASAAVATQIENRTSGLPAGSNNLVGIEPRLSENAVTENLQLAYEGASGSPVAARATTVIGRFNKVSGEIDGIRAGENSLLKHLPNQGSPKANWAQNSGVLRQEMNKGFPIRDTAVNPRTGELVDYPGSFLNAERNLLRDRG